MVARSRRGRFSLPRTRGDRPSPGGDVFDGRAPSPHTRGSTRSRARISRVPSAFPAHAGIDPFRAWLRLSAAGLPRTRGDRPQVDRRPSRLRWPSPHTRGSTHHSRDLLRGDRAFPAHAGIDVPAGSVWGETRCLPRTRGDRPAQIAAIKQQSKPSPRTRGSTFVRLLARRPIPAFPAHAGIDPRARCLISAPRCLPRTRGDRPWDHMVIGATLAPSPHTRGSTRRRGARGGGGLAFPAHAGIDQHRHRDHRAVLRLPRTRGDRPVAARIRPPSAEPSPHTRGSTHGDVPAQPARAAFPAHAGIDPALSPTAPRRTRLPRTRGDRPRFDHGSRTRLQPSPHTRGSTPAIGRFAGRSVAFPAHAGIDPTRQQGERRPPCLPRTRGDRPHPSAKRASCAGLPRTRGDRPLPFRPSLIHALPSPHTRGSTSLISALAARHAAFPAHAGIDPRRPIGSRMKWCLPRTRGDRPRTALQRAGRAGPSPHTRGSTLCIYEKGKEQGAFPAHAGIDLPA